MIDTVTLDEYQSRTSDTAIYPGKGTPLGLIYCGLKLAGEAGEVAEKIGKAIRDDDMIETDDQVTAYMNGMGHEREQAIKGELGDVLWYVARLARELGFDLSDVAQSNIDKLADRKQRGVLSGDGDNR